MFRLRTALPAALALALTASLAAPVGAANNAPNIDSNWMSDSRVLSASQARQALAQLPDDAPAPKSWHGQGGRLGLFGPAWADVDSNGCDTRNDILGRDLKQADYSRAPGIQGRTKGQGQGTSSCRNATVWSGVRRSPNRPRTTPSLRMGPRRLEMERLQTPTNCQRPTKPTSRRRQLQPSQRRLRPSHLPQRRLRQRHLEPLQLTRLVARKQQLQLQLRPPLRLRSLRLPARPTQSRQKLPIQSPL